jgi:predicted ATPase
LKEEKVWKNGEIVVNRPNDEDEADELLKTQTRLEQIHANKDFREIAEFFSSIKYLHLVPQLVREPDRSVGRTQDPYGGDFLEQIARIPKKTRDSRLNKIQHALEVVVPQLCELRFELDPRTGTPHLKGGYSHWRNKAAWQTEDQFSDGTLRLIGLLWSMQEKSGPLLLEEPELSLHHEVVRRLPQVMAQIMRKSERQLFVSTHSYEIIEDGVSPDEILMLEPSSEGTKVKSGKDDPTMVAISKTGETIADIALARTNPIKSNQIDLFELL